MTMYREVEHLMVVDEDGRAGREVDTTPRTWRLRLAGLIVSLAVVLVGSMRVAHQSGVAARSVGVMRLSESTSGDFLELAVLADKVDRFDDVMKYMKQSLKAENGKLSHKQRSMTVYAIIHYLAHTVSARKILTSMKDHEMNRLAADNAEEYLSTIDLELEERSKECLELIDTYLLPAAESDSTIDRRIEYLRTKADIYRHQGLVALGDAAYTIAMTEAQSLKAADAERIRVALNYAEFLFEVKHDGTKACEVAKAAFDNAMDVMNSDSSEPLNHQITQFLQKLRENLSKWSGEHDDDERRLLESQQKDFSLRPI